jgi:hypothetical protein
MFIDLTMEDERDIEKVRNKRLMRNQSESESEESILRDGLSDEESEVSDMNEDGMNDDSDLLMNRRGEGIISSGTGCQNVGGTLYQL